MSALQVFRTKDGGGRKRDLHRLLREYLLFKRIVHFSSSETLKRLMQFVFDFLHLLKCRRLRVQAAQKARHFTCRRLELSTAFIMCKSFTVPAPRARRA